jgi:two-component system OmpR family sensor kinase
MKQVLVVEDEPDIRNLIVLNLSREGFRCRTAASGAGVGLAIVKHLGIAQGGALAIESTVGTGTTVRVTLPAAPMG